MSNPIVVRESSSDQIKVKDLATILAVTMLIIGVIAIWAKRDLRDFRRHAPVVTSDSIAASDRIVPEIRSIELKPLVAGQKSVAVVLAEEAIIKARHESDLESDANYSSFWTLLEALEFRGKIQSADIALKAFLGSPLSTSATKRSRLLNYFDRNLFPAIDEYLRRHDYAGARRLVRRACSWVESLNTSPTLASDFPRMQAVINAIYRLDAVLENLDVVFQQQEAVSLIVNDTTGAKRIESETIKVLAESKSILIRAWAHYLAGAQALANRDFGSAGRNFSAAVSEAATEPAAMRLTDLALLGQARAVFWSVNLGHEPSDYAQNVLLKVRGALKSARFKRDIDFYVLHLGEKNE
jgi:hypothetical protein